MFLDALGIRLRHKKPDKSQQNVKGTAAAANGGYSGRGSEEVETRNSSSVTSSPNARSTKRYSNNIFGSGRLWDNTYIRSVAPSKSSGSSSRTVSLTPTEASAKKLSISSLPPVNPERPNILPISPEASPITYADAHADEDESTCSPSTVVPASYDTNHLEALSGVEYLLQNQLGFSNFKRASIALEQAMKEIEDELEEEILLPRTTIPRSNLDQLMPDVVRLDISSL
jgi:serine/arginine repetitive matrix protein 2